MNIIADIAGRYDELILLLLAMPQDCETIFIGDLSDRGSQSRQVVEFIRKNNYRCVMGNHEHLLVDHYRKTHYYDQGCWLYNGGHQTLLSYPDGVVPEDVIEWMENLPLYLEIDGNLISHSFIRPGYDLKKACYLGKDIDEVGETSIIWNRMDPIYRPEYKLQIIGHNGSFQKYYRENGEMFAICLDDCFNKRLTGYNTKENKIYQQEYIKKIEENICNLHLSF